jgi:uncharacterized protein (DUF3084 family)
MTSGYILIATILILGGIIAVSGDRIGTKVGKARLTLFKLRPRQTATLVTIVAGTLISGSVLSLIFGASPELRTGVFNLQALQKKLFETTQNLNDVLQQKDRVEKELEEARNAQLAAKNLLSGITKSLKDEILKQSIAAQNVKNTQKQLETVANERQQIVLEFTQANREEKDLLAQKPVLDRQIKELKEQVASSQQKSVDLEREISKINVKQSQIVQELDSVSIEPYLNLKQQKMSEYELNISRMKTEISLEKTRFAKLTEQLKDKESQSIDLELQIKRNQQKIEVRKALLKAKEKQYQQLETEFQSRAAQLKLKDRQLKKLEAQIQAKGQGLVNLEREVKNLEQEYKKVRRGNIGILRNQVLAAGILKAGDPEKTATAIQNLLLRANLTALKATHPDEVNNNRQIIQINPNQLSQLKEQINDKRDYIVRIFATGNYVIGDDNIDVFADATPNEKLFNAGDDLGSVIVDPNRMNEEEIRRQINILVFRAQLRSRNLGILDDRVQIGDGQLTSYVQLLEQIKQQRSPIEIKAIVSRNIYTADPLTISLRLTKSGKNLSL